MNIVNAVTGVFQSQSLHAAAWGFASTFAMCIVLVLTKRWHGAFTLDFTNGVQKSHTAPTPRVGGVPTVLGLLVAWSQTPMHAQDLLTPILIAGMPAFLFGLAEDVTRRVGVMQRLFLAIVAIMASGAFAWWLTDYAITRVDVWGADWFLKFTLISVIFTAFSVWGVANSINIIDGFNGLASTTASLALVGFGMIAWQVGDRTLSSVTLVLAACVWSFFWVNWPFGKLFFWRWWFLLRRVCPGLGCGSTHRAQRGGFSLRCPFGLRAPGHRSHI